VPNTPTESFIQVALHARLKASHTPPHTLPNPKSPFLEPFPLLPVASPPPLPLRAFLAKKRKKRTETLAARAKPKSAIPATPPNTPSVLESPPAKTKSSPPVANPSTVIDRKKYSPSAIKSPVNTPQSAHRKNTAEPSRSAPAILSARSLMKLTLSDPPDPATTDQPTGHD
jgi:hypothetical protein